MYSFIWSLISSHTCILHDLLDSLYILFYGASYISFIKSHLRPRYSLLCSPSYYVGYGLICNLSCGRPYSLIRSPPGSLAHSPIFSLLCNLLHSVPHILLYGPGHNLYKVLFGTIWFPFNLPQGTLLDLLYNLPYAHIYIYIYIYTVFFIIFT